MELHFQFQTVAAKMFPDSLYCWEGVCVKGKDANIWVVFLWQLSVAFLVRFGKSTRGQTHILSFDLLISALYKLFVCSFNFLYSFLMLSFLLIYFLTHLLTDFQSRPIPFPGQRSQEVIRLGLLNDFRKFDYQNFLSFLFSIDRNRILFPILRFIHCTDVSANTVSADTQW